MMSDPSNYHREYLPYGSYSLFQFERSDIISVLKNLIEYSFAFFKCLLKYMYYLHVPQPKNYYSKQKKKTEKSLSDWHTKIIVN